MSNHQECILCLSSDNVVNSSMELHSISYYRNKESKCECKYMIHQGCYEDYLRQYNAECMICKKALIYFEVSPTPIYHPLVQAPPVRENSLRQVRFNENIDTYRTVSPRNPFLIQPSQQPPPPPPQLVYQANQQRQYHQSRNNDIHIHIEPQRETVEETYTQISNRRSSRQDSCLTRATHMFCMISIVSLIIYIIVDEIAN